MYIESTNKENSLRSYKVRLLKELANQETEISLTLDFYGVDEDNNYYANIIIEETTAYYPLYGKPTIEINKNVRRFKRVNAKNIWHIFSSMIREYTYQNFNFLNIDDNQVFHYINIQVKNNTVLDIQTVLKANQLVLNKWNSLTREEKKTAFDNRYNLIIRK